MVFMQSKLKTVIMLHLREKFIIILLVTNNTKIRFKRKRFIMLRPLTNGEQLSMLFDNIRRGINMLM